MRVYPFAQFDFKKTFDLVPQDKLLINLSTFGFDEKFLLLFISYLFNRRQCVKLDQSVSELKKYRPAFLKEVYSVLCYLHYSFLISLTSCNIPNHCPMLMISNLVFKYFRMLALFN